MSCPTDGYNPVPDSDKPGRFADSPPVIVADFPGHSEISDPTETVERRLPSPAVSALRRKQLLPFYSRTPLPVSYTHLDVYKRQPEILFT